MQLAGDVVIGPHLSGNTCDFVLSGTPPKQIIYNTAELQCGTFFAAYPCTRHSSTSFAASPILVHESPLRSGIYSIAPLENVTRLHMFKDRERGLCRGILLEYRNGARRTVGQCRIGMDHVDVCTSPTAICFSPQTYCQPGSEAKRQALLIASTDQLDHMHDDKGWACCKMKGKLEFWFTAEESAMQVVEL